MADAKSAVYTSISAKTKKKALRACKQDGIKLAPYLEGLIEADVTRRDAKTARDKAQKEKVS